MDTYFNYFASGTTEAAWTFHISAIGFSRIHPRSSYPPSHHPEDRSFTWERGRVLNALQLIHITAGAGELEFRSSRFALHKGDVFILLPGVWHRYRPNPATGWTENWFELRGPAVDSWIRGGVLDLPPGSVLADGDFEQQLHQLHQLCAQPATRAIAAGTAMALLARAALCLAPAEHRSASAQIHRAKELLTEGRAIPEIARDLGMSYIAFYRCFTKTAGVPPRLFASQLRLARAENFLVSTDLAIKEIADRLGYHSAAHLSQDFKKARGKSPAAWRKEYR